MKVGDIVVCIEPQENLTYGKQYKIKMLVWPMDITIDNIIIVNNNDNIMSLYNANRFITLSEWRDIQFEILKM